MSEPRKFWMRWRVRTGYPVGVVYWLLAAPTPCSILICAAISAVGLFIRGAAAGHLRKDQTLATTGPYARTRNPLYFGSAFIAAGFAVAGRSWWAAALVAAYFAIFYSAVMRNEADDLRKRFGAAFDDYAARVPLFFPRIAVERGPAPSAELQPEQRFSWALYQTNRESRALIGTIAGLALLCVRMWLRAKFGY
jgi:protein-S-isoprenylcysteine O-methyltransferase Ste14